MDKISTIDVNGTEYEVVGPGGEYPISVINTEDSSSDGYSVSYANPQFYWKRTGESGSYEYQLVAFVSDDPREVSYHGTDASGR